MIHTGTHPAATAFPHNTKSNTKRPPGSPSLPSAHKITADLTCRRSSAPFLSAAILALALLPMIWPSQLWGQEMTNQQKRQEATAAAIQQMRESQAAGGGPSSGVTRREPQVNVFQGVGTAPRGGAQQQRPPAFYNDSGVSYYGRSGNPDISGPSSSELRSQIEEITRRRESELRRQQIEAGVDLGGGTALPAEYHTPGDTARQKHKLTTEDEFVTPSDLPGMDPGAAPGLGPEPPSTPKPFALVGSKDPDFANLSEQDRALILTYERALENERRNQMEFDHSLMNFMPVTPDQIEQYRQKFDSRERAMVDRSPRRIDTRTYCINLSPGFVPPVLRLTPNMITTIVLVDQEGQPWPLTTASLGSGEMFALQVLNNATQNQILITPMTAYGNSNMVITLDGNDIPLIIRLEIESGFNRNREVDGLIVFQIQEEGPNALPPVEIRQVAGPVNDILLSVLDGVAPSGSKLLQTQPNMRDSSIYQLGDTYYLRTRLKLMWPSFTSVLSGVGGFTVYEFPKVPSIMVSDDGEVQRLQVMNATGLEMGGIW